MASKNCHISDQLRVSKIGFIGAGNMAQAIIHGLVKDGQKAETLFCSNPSQGKLDALKARHSSINTSQSNTEVAQEVDILVLAVKPQKMSLALSSLQSHELSNTLIISVAAGVELETISAELKQPVAVIRAMPNTPSTIGLGATGLCSNASVSDRQKQLAETIFNAVGVSVWINDEAQMDLVTAISGSGPAHYFYFMESVIASAIEQGMEPDVAKILASQTALGAAKMVTSDLDFSIEQLRSNVTSPGGTTAAAIESMASDQLATIIDKAVRASVNRGKELSALSKNK